MLLSLEPTDVLSMKNNLLLAVLLSCVFFTAAAQQGECLYGDCKKGFGAVNLKPGDRVVILIAVGNFKNGNLQGPVTEYELGKGCCFYIRQTTYKNGWKVADGEQYLTTDGDGLLLYSEPDNLDALHVKCGWFEYEGHAKNKYPDGRGVLTYNAGYYRDLYPKVKTLDRYEGEFSNGEPDGKGTLYYTNGESDQVEFKESVLISPATPNERAFKEGCISGDCENGWGTYVWNHNKFYKYEGLWRNHVPYKFGLLFLMNGEMYGGEFNEEGQFHGWGTYFTYPSNVQHGYFEKGYFKPEVVYDYYGTPKAGIEFNAYTQHEKTKRFMETRARQIVVEKKQASPCHFCLGKGGLPIESVRCYRCKGRGGRRVMYYSGSDKTVKTETHSDGSRTITYIPAGATFSSDVCSKCKGTGRELMECSHCGGTGMLVEP
jgi:hypothetical protein